MVSKTIKNGIFYTSISLGSKTPFKDVEDDNDLKAANETIIRDFKAHLSELMDFVSTLKIEESKTIDLDNYLPKQKLKELGFK